MSYLLGTGFLLLEMAGSQLGTVASGSVCTSLLGIKIEANAVTSDFPL